MCACEFPCKNHEVQNLKFLVPGLLCKGQLSCSLCLKTVIEGKARDFQMLVRSIGTIIPSYAFCHHTVRVCACALCACVYLFPWHVGRQLEYNEVACLILYLLMPSDQEQFHLSSSGN